MTTDKHGRHIPRSFCSCGASPRGNGGHAAHRKMHKARGDGHRPVSRDLYEKILVDPSLRGSCDCSAGDQTGIGHRSQPPCPVYARYRATDHRDA